MLIGRSGLRSALVSVGLVCLVGGCANPDLQFHSFSFDTRYDSPNIEVLDYRYGDSRQPGVRRSALQSESGQPSAGTSVNGAMRRGSDLYVKWRIKATGEVLEETVDLESRLPADIREHRIHFIVNNRQLFVYLITPHRRPASVPPNGPRMYSDLLVKTIYPDLR
jgi:hypothetical protein